jgi:hypothetical protein
MTLVDEFGLGAGSIHTMTQMTTRIRSVSVPVADQDRALAFYTMSWAASCAPMWSCGREPAGWRWRRPVRR